MSDPQKKEVIQLIYEDFKSYLADFKAISLLAPQRFAQEDWAGIQQDSKDRLSLYKNTLNKTSDSLHRFFSNYLPQVELWKSLKALYQSLVEHHPAQEIAKTYYNSVFCRLYQHEIFDNDLLFVFDENPSISSSNTFSDICHSYSEVENLYQTFLVILKNIRFKIAFEDLERDTFFLAQSLKDQIFIGEEDLKELIIDIIPTPFYRNKGVYLLGRVTTHSRIYPLLIPFCNVNGKIRVDTLISDSNSLSIIFGFTRSYFLVNTPSPQKLVDFIHRLIPLKRKAELYNAIGYSKHGKTEFYRDFTQHLHQSQDKLQLAPGIKGMVMVVFVLPSYNVVFKLIRDHFEPPKNTSREKVKEKYVLVSRHDRVGRMADTHEFSNFDFPLDRFSDELLQELKDLCSSQIEIRGNQVRIKHLYTERKMTPLNLYLEQASTQQAIKVIEDYGHAIKQIAAANIFPGDMLLKNFGVTRHQRVIFYDYDEICFLTDCNFRTLPSARYEEDEWAREPHFSVGPNDVFPEEFKKFLIGRQEIRDIFLGQHPELFQASFWRDLQDRLNDGEIMDVFPYHQKIRFQNQFPSL